MTTGFFIVQDDKVVQLDYVHVIGRQEYTTYAETPYTQIHFEASFDGVPFTYWVDQDASESETLDRMVRGYRDKLFDLQADEDEEAAIDEDLRSPFTDRTDK